MTRTAAGPSAQVVKHRVRAWLDEIPAHWDVKPLKHAVTMNPEVLAEGTDLDYEIAYVDIGNVNTTGHVSDPLIVLFGDAPTRARKRVADGDTVISTVRTYLKAIAFMEQPPENLIVSTGFAVLRPKKDLNPWFLSHVVQSEQFIQSVVAHSEGVSYPAINASALGRLPIWLPPLPEQIAIATFLRRETARIDALVTKRQRLIELLEQKRSALITHVVTKGLDPNVPMKDSGVAWLGEIPAHWEARRLKWAITFQRGHDLPADDREEGNVPVVTSSGMSASHSVARAKAPGIVTGRYGTIGRFHLISEDYWPLNTTLYSIHLRGNEARYLRYMLEHLAPLFLVNAVKSAVPGVDRNDIHPVITAIPPVAEQQIIADYLESQTAEIDALINKARVHIERLAELRAALISAAVMGQLDIRGQAR